MNGELFDAIRAQIDQEINALAAAPAGIRMGFPLAGQFLSRGLLATSAVDLLASVGRCACIESVSYIPIR